MHIFLKTVEELLNRKGRKRPWLAQETGISLSTINTWFSSNRPPRVELAFKIAQSLSVSIETLLTGKEGPKKNYADDTLNKIISYLETKDHQSLMRIESVLCALEYLDLGRLIRNNIADRINDRLINDTLKAVLISDIQEESQIG